MAYIVTAETTIPDAGNNSGDIAIPVGHQANDLCVVIASQDQGTATISTPSGFTQIGTQAAVQGQRTTAFQRVLTSSSEPPVSMTGANDEWIIVTYLIRGVNTTTPINADNRTDSAGSTSSSLTLSGVTTTANNCMVLWACGWDNLYKIINNTQQTSVTMTKETTSGNAQITGYFNQATAGTTQNIEILSEITSEGGSGLMIAINDANPSSPQMSPHPLQSYSVLKRYGGITTAATNVAAFIRHDSVTWSKLDGTIIPTTINSINVLSTTTFSEVANQRADAPWGSFTSIRYGESGLGGTWVGAAHSISSTNMTNKIFSLEFAMNGVGSTLGAEGILVYFDDGTNWATFRLSRKSRFLANVTYMTMIDVSQHTPYASSGTINWGAITRVAYIYHRGGTSPSALDLSVKNALLHDKTIIVDGCPGDPANPTFLNRLLGGTDSQSTGHGAYLLSPLQGSGQSLAKNGIQYGNGTRPTYTNLGTVSHELPLRSDESLKNRFWRVENQAPAAEYRILCSATDTFRSISTIIASGTEQKYIIDASSSPSATYDFSAASIIGYNVENNADVIINGATLRDCSIDLNDGGLDACIIREQRGAATTSDPSKISNCDFRSPGSGHAIEADTPGTYAFEGNSFTGYGADSSTDAAFYNNSGGAIELVIPLGDDTPTIRNGVGATTTITQPTENQKVTLTNLVIGSRVQIYDLTDDSELLNIMADATTEVWEDTNPYVADREIRVRVAYVDGATAKQFIEVNIGTLTSTDPQVVYRVNQVDDTTYNTNAIVGSAVTGITIDDGTALISLNSSTFSWQNLYAYEMYWLFTETGIEDLGQSITAPDIANYLIDSGILTIKNVSGSATTLTGGWGRDKTTGDTLDVIDLTGDPLFANPPHVVAFQTIGTPVITGDISDVPTVSEIATGVWSDTNTYTGDKKGAVLQNAADDADTAANK